MILSTSDSDAAKDALIKSHNSSNLPSISNSWLITFLSINFSLERSNPFFMDGSLIKYNYGYDLLDSDERSSAIKKSMVMIHMA